uniref:Sister chromatid cohesion protein n=2 Tax=Opuntia streptacantha TaxID=393608 RepID=A0A7C8YYN1_OPUST
MALSEKELEKQLMEAGNALLSPPSSASELLPLLDRVERFLTRVEQSPSESMKKALSPSTKALIANDLLRHSADDVKVSVASCISEITRITAPDAPYDDDQMKEVFQLIVSSFEKLDDTNSPSYIKRTSILETVAKVRSCVVMLDLECDALIYEMFQHFLKSIR